MARTSSRSSPGDPTLAIAYLRVSTDDQHLGPEAQRAQIEAWASRAGARVVGWHLDQGVSGGAEIDQRPALLAALAELRDVRAGVLAVAKRDRLARDPEIAAGIQKTVERGGARVIAADGAGNGDSASDAFFRRIIDAAAEYERAMIRHRTRAALAAKKARGERAGTLPFGFQLGDGPTLVPHEAEQEVFALVHRLRREGQTLRAIVTDLASREVTSRGGRPLSLGSVRNLLRQAVPMGTTPMVTPKPSIPTRGREN